MCTNLQRTYTFTQFAEIINRVYKLLNRCVELHSNSIGRFITFVDKLKGQWAVKHKHGPTEF